ncbi:MAG: GNAT family N-acetyltransferase [Candidatus Dormibacteraeota bacterium]|nr:GNAT family N-acetyltransferase [Candidatus Dormibacteraeota bacterium]MBO0709280.1 GNAT family N-acetyltransferase [Candidatus Dormibacteraeota bacterium]
MKSAELDPTPAEARAVPMVRALANPARFRMVQVLAERKDTTFAQLAAALPLAPSSIYEHLTALRRAGLVQASGVSEGQATYFCLDPAAFDFLGALVGGLGGEAREWRGLVSRQQEGGMRIREATVDDAAAIARIYNQGIEDRVATLETELRTPEERAAWLATHDERHPVLVCVDGGDRVLGWASLNVFNPREAYRHVVDFSAYVAREERGHGVGDLLLSALEERARALGYHKIVLAAFPSNAPGMRLYERHRFRTVGVYQEQGRLDGAWVDTIVMEKLLR